MTTATTVRERPTRLLLPLLDEDRRSTWLTQAFYDQDNALYHAIDPRPGVGLRPDGVPEIVWHAIAAGEVALDSLPPAVAPGACRRAVCRWPT